MNFNEAIPCLTIGDMISNDLLTKSATKSVKSCYTCGCRLSMYNSSDRCFPCRKAEKTINVESINNIFCEVNNE